MNKVCESLSYFLVAAMLLVAFTGCESEAPAATRNYKPLAAAILATELGDAPQPTPAPAPSPGGKCDNCNGKGKLGDGVVSVTCPVCGGDGIKSKHAPDIAPVTPDIATPSKDCPCTNCTCDPCECASNPAREAGVSGDDSTADSLAAPVLAQLAAPRFHRWQVGPKWFGTYGDGKNYEYRNVRVAKTFMERRPVCGGGQCELQEVQVTRYVNEAKWVEADLAATTKEESSAPGRTIRRGRLFGRR